MPISKEFKSYLREAWVNYRIWLTGSLALFLFSIFNAFWFQNKLPFVVVYTIATLGLVRVLTVDGFRNYHEDNPTTVFVLHPDGKQRIGLVRGQDGENSIWVKHTLAEQNLNHVIPGTKCRLIVSATGKDIPQLKTVFTAWIDEDGKLQCQFEKTF